MLLKTFGELGLEADADDTFGPAAVRRRPLALLAVLAVAGTRAVSRERLCALFWPESDSDRARNSLNQMLFALRRDLGHTDLLLGSTELQLNPSRIRSDVGAFDTAIKSGQLEDAVALYRGPFLDGVYLKETPKEFEEWVEIERARLDDCVTDAIRSLATAATSRGEHTAAVRFWKRFATLRPADSRATGHLMRALVSAGNSAAALEHARVHQAYLRTQFGIPVDEEVTALIAQISADTTTASGSRVLPTADTASTLTAPSSAFDSPVAEPAPLATPTSLAFSTTAVTRPRPSVWSARRAFAVLLVLIALAVFSTARTPAWGSRAVKADTTLIAVLPFAVRGDSTATYLREGLVDLLSTDLDEAGDLHTVDPHVVLATEANGSAVRDLESANGAARKLGAGLFVLGDVAQSGGRLRLSATLYHTMQRDRPAARVTAEGSSDSLFQLTSILTRRLLAGRVLGPDGLTGLAATETNSLDALKAYLKGQQAMRSFRNREAMEAFQLAEGLDSAFALAPYTLSAAADWSSQGDVARLAADRALRHSTSLPPRARWLLHAEDAWRRGAADEAEGALRQILDHHPDDVEARNMLAEVLFHLNAARGRPLLEALPEFEKVLQFHPGDYEALLHLGRLAAFQGQRERLSQLIPQIATARPRGDDEARLLYAARFQSPAQQAALFDSIVPGTSITLAVLCWRVAVYSRRPDRAEPLCRKLTEGTHEAEWRAVGYRRLAELALATGRFREASSDVAALAALVPEQAIELAAWISVMPLAPPSTSRSAAYADLLIMRRDPPDRITETFAPFNSKHGLIREYLLGTFSLQRGDTLIVEAAARRLEETRAANAAAATLARNFARMLRAELAARSGRTGDAISLLAQNAGERSSAGDRWPGEELLNRYRRGQLLTRAGKYDEALNWFASFTDPYVEDIVMEAPGELASAQLELQRGNDRMAALHYRRFAELWRNANPELQPMVEEARQHAQMLEMNARKN